MVALKPVLHMAFVPLHHNVETACIMDDDSEIALPSIALSQCWRLLRFAGVGRRRRRMGMVFARGPRKLRRSLTEMKRSTDDSTDRASLCRCSLISIAVLSDQKSRSCVVRLVSFVYQVSVLVSVEG